MRKHYLPLMQSRSSIGRVANALLGVMIVLTMLAGSVLRVAAAGLHYGMMSCCCGEHSSGESCGCPDCPVAHDDDTDATANDDASLPASSTPTISKCGPNASITALASEAPVRVTTPILTIIEQTISQPDVPLAAPLLSRLPVSPDAPPPRN